MIPILGHRFILCFLDGPLQYHIRIKFFWGCTRSSLERTSLGSNPCVQAAAAWYAVHRGWVLADGEWLDAEATELSTVSFDRSPERSVGAVGQVRSSRSTNNTGR